MVLLIDHDLAASTLAARVAASARAHPYAVVSAGLGAMDGPLHGAASGLAHRMLADVLERGSAAAVVADHLRAGRRVPGLGHRLYPGADPRAQALFARLESIPQAARALEAAREVEATTARHMPLHANVDLALAVLSVSADMLEPKRGKRCSPSPGRRAGSPMRWRNTPSAPCGCAPRASTTGRDRPGRCPEARASQGNSSYKSGRSPVSAHPKPG
ncbi:hypothetical protein GCM10020000_20380 [Streptomyces olivoverticillatus]